MTSPADQATFLRSVKTAIDSVDSQIADQLTSLAASNGGSTTPPPVVTPTGPTTPSAPAVSFIGYTPGDVTVWKTVPEFKDDFPTPVTYGNFPQTYKYWYVYPKGWKDTSKLGTYDPARIAVVTLDGGGTALRQLISVASDGSYGGCVLCPEFGSNGVGYLTDMRYTERVRLTQQDNGHYALLGWPANDGDWETKSGEPDMVEDDTLNNPTFGGFVHVIGDSGDAHKVEIKSDVKMYDDFHVVTIEQLPSQGAWRRYIDGKLYNVILNPGVAPTAADMNAWAHPVILTNGLKVPGSDPLRVCKQLEGNGQKPSAGGVILDTDYVVVQAHV